MTDSPPLSMPRPHSPPRFSWPWIVLPLLGTVAYANSFAAPFHFDDDSAIVENAYVQQLWPPQWLWGAPQESSLSTRPLASLTFVLNFAVGGLDPRGYHAVNILLHIANGLLLWWWMRTILRRSATVETLRSAADGLSLTIAALWLIHPLQTEAVTYIVQRTDLLASFFILATMLCAATIGDGPWSRRHTLAVVCCLLGVMCKETAAMTPLLVPLADRAFWFASWRETFARRGRLYAGLAMCWPLLAALMIASPRSGVGFWTGVSPIDYLAAQCRIVPHYLQLVFLPIGLCADYGSQIDGDWRTAWPGALLLLALFGTTVWFWKVRPAVGFLGAWFFLLLAPTSSIIPIATEVGAERRMYLPSVAVLAAVVTAFYLLMKRGARGAGRTGGLRRLMWVLPASLVALLLLLTVRRNVDYQTRLAFWTNVVERAPDNPRAHHNLAAQWITAGNLIAAEIEDRRAVALQPTNVYAVSELAALLDWQLRFTEADAVFDEALRRDPKNMLLVLNAARRLENHERYAEAETLYRRASELAPQNAELRETIERLNRSAKEGDPIH